MARVLTRMAAAAALVGGLVVVDAAGPARAETYPSWDDVAAAKANAASAQAQVDRINGLLAGLQTAANAAADEAVRRAAEYAAAQTALEAASRAADDLAARAQTAATTADSLRVQSGSLAAQLSRGGGSDASIRLFLSGGTARAESLLYQLGTVSKLADQSGALFARATEQKNLAASLSDQAASARAARQEREAAAEKASAAATAAKAASDAALAEQQARADTMYAQLASLKNTQASVEKQYAEGVAAREAERRAAEQPANPGGGADTSAPPPGVVVNPAAAQAYASSRLPAYGWGSDQMSCLVKLWTKESSWRADAYNTSSGAYGIPQALPGSKMASAGGDWMTNANTQINWGLSYISGRYGSPCAAWSFHLGHNWY